MSDNNNNNNIRNINNNSGNTNNDDGSRSNNGGRRNNGNSGNNNGNSNGSNNDSNSNQKKGACEELGCNVFDCSLRKNVETCKKSLKALATFVGTGKDFGREASDLKCVIEHLEDPEMKPPDDLDGNDTKVKTLWFKCTEACNRHLDKMDSLEVHTNDVQTRRTAQKLEKRSCVLF